MVSQGPGDTIVNHAVPVFSDHRRIAVYWSSSRQRVVGGLDPGSFGTRSVAACRPARRTLVTSNDPNRRLQRAMIIRACDKRYDLQSGDPSPTPLAILVARRLHDTKGHRGSGL